MASSLNYFLSEHRGFAYVVQTKMHEVSGQNRLGIFWSIALCESLKVFRGRGIRCRRRPVSDGFKDFYLDYLLRDFSKARGCVSSTA